MNRADGVPVRLLRPWHGRPVGAVIRPPGAIREVLLASKDQSGTPFAELVTDPPVNTSQEFGGKSKAGKGKR